MRCGIICLALRRSAITAGDECVLDLVYDYHYRTGIVYNAEKGELTARFC